MATFENKTDASSAVKYGKANTCAASRVAVEGRTEKTRINPIAAAECGRNQSSFAYVAQAVAKGEKGEKMSEPTQRPTGDAVENDPVNKPKHYTTHPSGVECIQITEHMSFNLGNALKYIWRADLKGNAVEDLQKAKYYLDRELQKRGAT